MATPELQKFRAKYPGYDDIDDITLATKLAAKYPDAYGDLPSKVRGKTIDVSVPTPSEEQMRKNALENEKRFSGKNIKDYFLGEMPDNPILSKEYLTQNVPRSLVTLPVKAAYGLGKTAYDLTKSITDPAMQAGLYLGNAANAALGGDADYFDKDIAAIEASRKPTSQVMSEALHGTAKTMLAPFGVYGGEEANKAWNDPAMALAGISPTVKPMLKGAGKLATTTGKLTTDTLGLTTGMQKGVKQSFEAGIRKGENPAKGKDFADYYTGRKGQEDLLNSYKDALSDMKETRAMEYQTALADISKNKTQLDISPIQQKWNEYQQKFGIKTDADGNIDLSRSTLSRKEAGDLAEISDMMKDWGTQANDLTPSGLDLLKRKLDNLYTESKDSRAIVTGLRNAVKNTIVKDVPEYAEMTKGYADATELLNEAQSALSLKNKMAGDTALRKINQVMRENFDFRRETIQKMEEQTGANLLDQTAGYQANQWRPRGSLGVILGASEAAALYSAGLTPASIAALALSSPKIVGGMMYGLGIPVGMAKNITAKLPRVKAWMQQTGQDVQAKLKDERGLVGKDINFKRESYKNIDEMKEWLNKNVEHWTWITGGDNPLPFATYLKNRLPANKIGEFESLFNKYQQSIGSHVLNLEKFIAKKKLSDFTPEDLKTPISYADMQIATGYKKLQTAAENKPALWAIEDGYGKQKILKFRSRREAEDFAKSTYSEVVGVVGPERIFFRKGNLPEGGKSYNSMDNKFEKGVSVYVTPQSGSMAGEGNRPTYYGKGRQITTGGDDEPIIIPSGKWRKFKE